MKSAVLWLTGLSGSGKSTLAKATAERLQASGIPVERLDGDVVRDAFSNTGFDKESRDRHIRQMGFMASLLEKHGVTVVCSFISPYRDARDEVRRRTGRFVEIHVSTPVEVCEERDVKGLYRKARAGEITNFTGVNDPYEAPKNPELSIDTSKLSVEEAVGRIINYLES